MDYKKLFKDKVDGKIDKDMFIIMDNDGGYWQCKNNSITKDARDAKTEEYKKTYGTPDGFVDVVNILDAAGFNAEWC